jgi:GGDEF domain-containing protein
VIQTAKGPLTVTMSLGLLLSSEWRVKPVEELLHEADIALYEAKGAGRDCLRMAKPSMPVELAPVTSPESVRLRH